MNKTTGSYKAAKYIFFAASLLVYFVPFIVVTACLLPLMKQTVGTSFAIGAALIVLNALPFIGGVFRSVLAHFPFVNLLSVVFLLLYGFFTLDLFSEHVYIFCWIEFAAAVGSLLSCVFWHFYGKYSRRVEIAKTNKEMGLI